MDNKTLIEALRHCGSTEEWCATCPERDERDKCDILMDIAADTIENLMHQLESDRQIIDGLKAKVDSVDELCTNFINQWNERVDTQRENKVLGAIIDRIAEDYDAK